MFPLRHVVLTLSVFMCILYFYTQPFRNIFPDSVVDIINAGLSDMRGMKFPFPDFGEYVSLGTLEPHQFPLDDPTRRVIIVGDIHGEFEYLQKLLKKVEYDSSSDVLVHVGDIMAKGSHEGSMSVISYMAKHNITGVRGNHDQMVIEWRAWLDWINDLPGGPQFLVHAYESWEKAEKEGMSLKHWLKRQSRHPARGTAGWWKRIPDDWQLFGDHCSIAHDLSLFEWEYLRNLPLRLHIPSAHTFIVHAGMLPEDIRYKKMDERQPLAYAPVLGTKKNGRPKVEEAMRQLQEIKVLDIHQNLDPYVVLNMRSIVKGKPTRDTDGDPWSDLWNEDMELCSGYSLEKRMKDQQPSLPCMPSTVVYGHAAGRGLDINRWTIGLDTGCVYGRKMTALVLGRAARGAPKAHDTHEDEDEDDEDDDDEGLDEEEDMKDRSILASRKKNKHHNRRIPYGDSGHGRLYKVRCR